MLGWALSFLVIPLIAGAIGFGGTASASISMAQIIFLLFLVLFALAMLARAIKGKPPI